MKASLRATDAVLQRRGRHLAIGAACVALLVVAGLGATLMIALRDAEHQARSSMSMYARVLESRTRATLDGLATGLKAVGGALPAAHVPTAASIRPRLAELAGNQPALRSVSLVDMAGRVIASSAPENEGQSLGAGRVGPVPQRAQTRLGAPLPGRDLVPADAGGSRYTIPMVHRIDRGDAGADLLLVALLNPEFFTAQYVALVGDAAERAALVDDKGRIVAAGIGIDRLPGSGPVRLAAFANPSPDASHGNAIGEGLAANKAVNAFRAVRGWPLFLLIEQPYEDVWSEYLAGSRWVLAGGLLAFAGLLAAFCAAQSGLAKEMATLRQLSDLDRQAALREQRWKMALDGAGHGVWEVDLQEQTGTASARLMALLGYGPDDAVWTARRLHELLHPEDREPTLLALQRHLSGHAPAIEIELRLRSQDGHWICLHCRGALLSEQHEGAAGRRLIGTITDVTERRRMERALRSSEERLRAIFEQAAVGIALHVASGSGVVRVDVNPALCRILGRSREDLLAHPVGGLIHPEDAPAGRAALARLLGGEIDSVTLEQRYLHSGGSYVWMRVSAALAHGDGGGAPFIVAVLEDVSPQRRAQLELERARARELEIGARIQQSLLVTRARADLPGIWLSAFNQASQGIDGDFLEIIRHGPCCVDLISGDVMGKGVNAALLGAAVKMQFSRTLAELLTLRAERGEGGPEPEPCAIVEAVHDAMTPSLQALDAFVTLSYVRIDAARQTLTWVGCGHEEPLLARVGGGLERLANQHPPLGVLEGQRYRQDACELRGGDGLLLHSDGVPDARMPGGTRVGHERLRAAVAEAARACASPGAVVQRLRRELVAGATVTDDLTMLFARVVANPYERLRLELPRLAKGVTELRFAVGRMAARTGMAGPESHLFTVAAVEAFTNIVRHASGMPDHAPIEVLLEATGDTLAVEFVYAADPFEPPGQLPDTRLEDLPDGGFGLRIIQRCCDRVEYRANAGICTTRLELWRQPAP